VYVQVVHSGISPLFRTEDAVLPLAGFRTEHVAVQSRSKFTDQSPNPITVALLMIPRNGVDVDDVCVAVTPGVLRVAQTPRAF
jgi:hypothetical protein